MIWRPLSLAALAAMAITAAAALAVPFPAPIATVHDVAYLQRSTIIAPEPFVDTEIGVSGHWEPPRRRDRKTARLVAEASRWVGRGPRDMGLHRFTLWCAAGVNRFLRNIGLPGTGSDLAISFAKYGKPSKPKPGVIAVKRRRGGHHVVVVKEVRGRKMVVISPNGGGGKVRQTIYPITAFHTFVEPSP